MTEATFQGHSVVKLVRHMAADNYVIQAAQVSAKGENNPDTVPERLIRALMTGRHGSPFEHTSFTFFVEAPLFVFREWQRHRMSSFNEMSGRYTTLPGKFYIPPENRKMVNSGTKMKPRMVYDRNGAGNAMRHILAERSKRAWKDYQEALENGIANEVASMVLTVNVFSQMYWTVNARSLMNFLSLRVESDDSTVRSYPQLEIDDPARIVENHFKRVMPLTHKAFVENGRVAP